MVVKKANKKSLKEIAEENTSIVKNNDIIKEGTPNDHTPKHNINMNQPNYNPKIAGVSIGLTLNMGDYESLRIDCWLTDEVQEGETQQEALIRLSDIIQKQLEYEVQRIRGE